MGLTLAYTVVSFSESKKRSERALDEIVGCGAANQDSHPRTIIPLISSANRRSKLSLNSIVTVQKVQNGPCVYSLVTGCNPVNEPLYLNTIAILQTPSPCLCLVGSVWAPVIFRSESDGRSAVS